MQGVPSYKTAQSQHHGGLTATAWLNSLASPDCQEPTMSHRQHADLHDIYINSSEERLFGVALAIAIGSTLAAMLAF